MYTGVIMCHSAFVLWYYGITLDREPERNVAVVMAVNMILYHFGQLMTFHEITTSAFHST